MTSVTRKRIGWCALAAAAAGLLIWQLVSSGGGLPLWRPNNDSSTVTAATAPCPVRVDNRPIQVVEQVVSRARAAAW